MEKGAAPTSRPRAKGLPRRSANQFFDGRFERSQQAGKRRSFDLALLQRKSKRGSVGVLSKRRQPPTAVRQVVGQRAQAVPHLVRPELITSKPRHFLFIFLIACLPWLIHCYAEHRLL